MSDQIDNEFPEGVQSILDFLGQNDVPYQVKVFDSAARHASEAAVLVGCPLAAIVKSLVCQTQNTREGLMVLVSGQNRADLNRLGEIIGQTIVPASPQDVLTLTGYPVGAVPPFALGEASPVVIDADLMALTHVWASAGAVNILMRLNSGDLHQVTQGTIVDI